MVEYDECVEVVVVGLFWTEFCEWVVCVGLFCAEFGEWDIWCEWEFDGNGEFWAVGCDPFSLGAVGSGEEGEEVKEELGLRGDT